MYNRRKKKVLDLLVKEDQLLYSLRRIREENYNKYLAIMDIVTFFCEIKEKVYGGRADYYSNKTFLAMKNATEHELRSMGKVFKKMYNDVVGSDSSLKV